MTTATVTPEAPIQSSAEPVQTDILTVNDRCDTCPSQAYLQTILKNGNDLMWCAHHYTKAEEKIAPLTASLIDERWKLYATAKLDVSAD